MGKVFVNGNHPAHLLYAEGAAVFAVSALQAGICLDSQFGIVVSCDVITGQSQVVILVYKANVDACGAGLAMVAIDAGTGNGVGSKGADDGIVLFRLGGIQEFQNLIQMLHGLHTGQNCQHTGPVDGILQALAVGQGLAEGGLIRRQKLTKK